MTRMMRTVSALASLPWVALLAAPVALAGTITAPVVERVAPDRLAVRWKDADAVDVFQSDRADTSIKSATLVSSTDKDGVHEVTVARDARPYFLLRDTRSKAVVRVAERVLTLEQASNFRDVGGYPAAGGKHVRWGMIYRSGGQPMMTDADVAEVKSLGVANLIDLRSDEERIIAPTKLDGIPYNAVGYSMAAIMKNFSMKPDASGKMQGAEKGYLAFPTQLAPQLRIVFRKLLSNEGPILYNCSAGQDRTGFTTAIILSALGVSRDIIYADYLLSTPSRRTEWEMAPISDGIAQTSPIAGFFAQMQKTGAMAKANPLVTDDGTPFLAFALEAVDKEYGSVDAYLARELGVTKLDIAALRVRYLE